MLVFKLLLCLFSITLHCMCTLFTLVFFLFCCGIADCPEGTELKSDGTCVKCPHGYYRSILEDVCMKCPAGITTDRDGSESAENCYLSLYLVIINSCLMCFVSYTALRSVLKVVLNFKNRFLYSSGSPFINDWLGD